MNKIIERQDLATSLKKFVVEAPMIARRAQPGQFVMLRVHEQGERIPLTIADFDRERGTITLVAQEVGRTTRLLGRLNEGDYILDLLGPLGEPTAHPEGKNAVCIGGGVGIAPVYPEAKELHQKGYNVTSIIGARTSELLFFEEEMAAVSNELFVATDDGSKGHHGFVTDILQKLIDEGRPIDFVIAVGPIPMMKAVADLTRKYGIKTIVSLNSMMVDGTGMCGGCRVTVGGEVKFTCVDGPSFDAHLLDFDEQMRRLCMYREQEKMSEVDE
ncbi:MAG: sulfide/dihydroorotate dehydrogenase-like FAD/NAD-binding protein [Firmicutes bacterium]|nr:sulfide/dihydroorotate dehydrogenase-like FAD/NAD-binding protein [Bacillota bacterium]HOB35005.1 sulfide/dihydroorotate dehydrogenase-like FAD/NAD-binding protein [Bacillota bacterium]HPZ90324.1 sulfide/dihydroorotate dehydrogenase-like FAD/NAD-binding protein [Bacillota bacterium]HQE01829.1 sulfide/dihydroorotate dehydrogenase-like FAD/NAD-binding protein [Bacillota bacterium]